MDGLRQDIEASSVCSIVKNNTDSAVYHSSA